MKAICYLLLAHGPPGEVARLIERWQSFYRAPSKLLLGYGGAKENFNDIKYEPKIFIDDPRLRTRDHQREKQSYSQIFTKAAGWLADFPECAYIYLAEFDHWPLVPDLDQRLIHLLEREQADVLGHELARKDRTNCVYYLHHLADERFLPWLRKISRRADPEAVFTMLGTGTFWTREAFLAVAASGEPFPIYLETYLPTIAHHLGFRLRDFGDQNRFVRALGNRSDEIDAAVQAGAWTLHPVKTWPAPSLPDRPPSQSLD